MRQNPMVKQMIANNILECIGNTPMVRINHLNPNPNIEMLIKLEKFNPGGSVKDRITKYMIENAEKSGQLKKGMIVIEPTSGNTGIGLAAICAAKGLKLILTMPESMSIERRKILMHLGAELVLTPASEGMGGAIAKASALEKGLENAKVLQQFNNPNNPDKLSDWTVPMSTRFENNKPDGN